MKMGVVMGTAMADAKRARLVRRSFMVRLYET